MILPEISEQTRVVVIAGLEGPELLKHCLKLSPQEGRLHLVIDSSETGVSTALEKWQLSSLQHDARFIWFSGTNIEDFSTFILSQFSTRKRLLWLSASEILKDARAFQSHSHELNLLLSAYGEQQKALKRLTGFKEDGLSGLDRLIENFDWLKSQPGVVQLTNLAKGMPAIVASTGPSLTKSLPLLKSLQNQAVIIAPDASLKALLAAGIHPHLVCSLERDMSSKPFFENLKSWPEEHQPHLVAHAVVPKLVIECFPGPTWVSLRAYRQHGYFEAQLKKGILTGGHSVSHMCVSLADKMGCDPIVLVGQDLSFDPDNFSTHAQDVAYSEWSQAQSEQSLRDKLKSEGDDLYWLPGNLTERVPTRAYYAVFAREFGVMAKDIKAKLWNATLGGLRIPFVPWKSLESISSQWSVQENVTAKLNQLYTQPREKSELSMKPLLEHIEKLQVRLKQDIQIAEQLKGPMVLANLKKTWNDLESDHVIEGFGLEILGDRGVELQIALNEVGSRESFVELFKELSQVLKDVQVRFAAHG